ncbi:MAG TPA: hypothetical protein VLL05_16070, partial [Terriglobales bacterium]|nr:hypothetical protein [Terriglobales bacterium]
AQPAAGRVHAAGARLQRDGSPAQPARARAGRHDIEVARKPGGRPSLVLHGKAAEFAAKLGATNIALSLTHTAEQAMAQVILES